MQNIDKLYTLYARIPGSVYHYRFHPYKYICPKTATEKQEKLKDVDIAIYGFLHMNSDMRQHKNGGTGLTQWFSAKDISDASKADVDSKPEWSLSTVKRSLSRLGRGGFLIDKVHPNAKRRAKLFDPALLPSRKKIIEEQIENRRSSTNLAETMERIESEQDPEVVVNNLSTNGVGGSKMTLQGQK